MKHFIYITLVVLLCACQSSKESMLTSPDGKVQVVFTLGDNGEPTYSVCHNGKPVLLPSALGLETAEQSLTSRFRIDSISRASCDTIWETVWGEERFIRDCHNEMTVHLRHTSGTRMDIVFRAFNDGFALRYKGVSQGLTILSEKTSYIFAETPEAWSIPWRTEYYEALWTKAPITEMDTVCAPITLQLADGTYAFLHEAALINYPAENFYFRGDTIHTFLTPLSDGTAAHLQKSPFKGDLEGLPWRFMSLVDDLQGLVASRIMLNLNEPCRITDTSWIKPMKFIGIWWGMHLKTMTWWNGPQHGATTQRMKQ